MPRTKKTYVPRPSRSRTLQEQVVEVPDTAVVPERPATPPPEIAEESENEEAENEEDEAALVAEEEVGLDADLEALRVHNLDVRAPEHDLRNEEAS